MPAEHWATFLATFARDLAAAPDLDRISSVVTDRFGDVLPEAEHVALTLRGRRGPTTTSATSSLARDADQLQGAVGEGPLLDGFVDGDHVRSGDLEREVRWPGWSRAASERGARSMLAVGLVVGDDLLGAVTAYAEQSGSFADRRELEVATLFATHASVALASHREATGLRAAMGSRHTIGLAQGILMREFDLDVDGAFALLTRYSSLLNVKLRVLAEQVVERRRLPDEARQRPAAGSQDGS